MLKIEHKTVVTPMNAHFVKPVSKSKTGVITVEYYSANKIRLAGAPFAATVMKESTYEKMVKSPKEPAGKAETDPRRKDQDKRRGLPKGKELTGIEKELLELDTDELDLDDWLEPSNNEIKKRAKENPSHSLGGKVETPKKMSEGVGDESTFTAKTIREVLFSVIGSDKDTMRHIMKELIGKEMSTGIGESTFDRLYALTEEPVVYDPDGAQDEFQASQEGDAPEEKKKIGVGSSLEELNAELMNLSDGWNPKEIRRGVKVTIFKIADSRVQKILPAQFISTATQSDGGAIAKIKVIDIRDEIPLMDGNFKQFKDGRYVYIKNDESEEPEENQLNINYQG